MWKATPRVGPTREEIEDFDRELDKLMNEGAYGAPREARASSSEIRIPMNIHKQPSKGITYRHFIN